MVDQQLAFLVDASRPGTQFGADVCGKPARFDVLGGTVFPENEGLRFRLNSDIHNFLRAFMHHR